MATSAATKSRTRKAKTGETAGGEGSATPKGARSGMTAVLSIDVAGAAQAHQLRLERLQPARLEPRLPQSPGGVQQVEVGRLGQREAVPVEAKAGVEERNVEARDVESCEVGLPEEVEEPPRDLPERGSARDVLVPYAVNGRRLRR